MHATLVANSLSWLQYVFDVAHQLLREDPGSAGSKLVNLPMSAGPSARRRQPDRPYNAAASRQCRVEPVKAPETA